MRIVLMYDLELQTYLVNKHFFYDLKLHFEMAWPTMNQVLMLILKVYSNNFIQIPNFRFNK